MIVLSSILVGLTALLVTVLVAQLVSARPRELQRRLAELERDQLAASRVRASDRPKKLRHVSALLVGIGERAVGSSEQRLELKERLANAGYRSQSAVALYWSLRLVLSLGLAASTFFLLSLVGAELAVVLLAALWLTAMGWLGPSFYLGLKAKAREREIQSALADTLDLLVVCIDAGLGLNQAWLRVAEEIRSVSRAMSEELALVNLQIRAGVPREEALHNLATRSRSADMRSLAGVLIQTDRFGTSVSQALRVQAASLRMKRRHRAEEAAAKTAVKLSFPLVFLILPALFVVIMGGAAIEVMRGFSNLK